MKLDRLGRPSEKKKAECPNRDNHYIEPEMGYIQWYGWAEEMGKTHKQSQCPDCKLYVIWTPKKISKT